jgi:hypothetical protein
MVDDMPDAWSDVPDTFAAEVGARYVARFSDPDVTHAICEQYRAAGG